MWSLGSPSKSGPIFTKPFASPRRRCGGDGSTRTNLTTGLPARAMTISSPASARAKSAARQVSRLVHIDDLTHGELAF